MKKCMWQWLRRKHIDWDNLGESQLKRCLTVLDLTALGVGTTLGAGVYAIIGDVGNNHAGPAIIISFLIAAIASLLAGLCYAEFGARVPKTGSAYVYCYVTVGELTAFIIGWNLILEYIIGCSSTAKAWSNNFDSLIYEAMSKWLIKNVPIDIPNLSTYVDIFALGITLLLTVIIAFGIKESSLLNNVLTAVNILVIVYTVICGLFKADINNWQLTPPDIYNGTKGSGGFAPYGVSGILDGAAICFFAFIGFDVIATTGEEAKNPQRAIPLSIVLSLIICFLAYFGMSAVVTLMAPYYFLDPDAPLPRVFENVHWPVAKYVVSVGAFCGLLTSLLGSMLPLPRIIYAMAKDGLVFKFLARINTRFQTPMIATLLSGILAGVLAMLFNLKQLIEMMSIGTLVAYTMVAVCVLILRYKPNYFCTAEETKINDQDQKLTPKRSYRQLMKAVLQPNLQEPTESSSSIVTNLALLYVYLTIIDCAIIIFGNNSMEDATIWGIVLTAIFSFKLLVIGFLISRQPQSTNKLNFQVPWVPFIPCLSIFINTYLILKLSLATWIRFAVWLVLGLLIYVFYGKKNSEEEKHMNLLQEEVLNGDEHSVQKY